MSVEEEDWGAVTGVPSMKSDLTHVDVGDSESREHIQALSSGKSASL